MLITANFRVLALW